MRAAEPQSRGVINAMMLGVLIYGLAMGSTYPLLGMMLSERVSETWNGVAAAAAGLGQLGGMLLAPAASRRLGAGRVIGLGVAVMAVSLAALAAAPGYWSLFAARVALGVGSSLLFIIAETALNTLAAPERRGRTMGVYTAATAVGFVIGPSVAAWAVERPALLLLACAGLTALALPPLLRARRPVSAAVSLSPVSGFLPVIRAYPFPFAFLLVASAYDAVVIALLPVIARAQGYALATGALLAALFHLGLLLAQPLIGASLDLLGRRRTTIACAVASLLATAGLAAAPSLDSDLGFWLSAALVFAWGGASYGLYTAALALIGDRFTGPALGAATASFAGVYALAAMVAPILAGGLLEGLGAGGFYLTTAGIYLLTALAGLFFFRPPEPTLRACAAPTQPSAP